MDYIYNNFYINDNYTNFITLLDTSGYFRNIDNINKVMSYVYKINGKTYVLDTNTNLKNIETKFSDQKSTIEWLIISSQIAFFARNKDKERWESTIPWLNKNNIDIVYSNLKHLAFTEEVNFSKKTYKNAIILGASYFTMKKRFLYLISKLDKLKTDKITFLTANDRFVKFDKELNNCTNKRCLNKVFSGIDNTFEQKVFYTYFKKKFGIKYIFRFTKKFKEVMNSNTITEKTMADILLHNYKSKIKGINSRVLGSYATKENGRNRANTGDTIATLLQEDNIRDIRDFDGYVFVSGQPHIETQKIATITAIIEYFNISSVMPDGFSVEYVGYGDKLEKTESSIKLHLQTFAGTLFNKYILLLSQQTGNLNDSKNHVVKNLSYNAVKDLIQNTLIENE